MWIRIASGLDSQMRARFWNNDKNTRQFNPVLRLPRKNVKRASSISGNHLFLGPANFIRDASHSLIAALCSCHSRTPYLSTSKFVVALRFPFSSGPQTTSCLTFVLYGSLLDFWHTSSLTTVHDILLQAPLTL
jgi:hypothetical protein